MSASSSQRDLTSPLHVKGRYKSGTVRPMSTALGDEQGQTKLASIHTGHKARLFEGGHTKFFGHPISRKIAAVFTLDVASILIGLTAGWVLRLGILFGVSHRGPWIVLDKYTGATVFMIGISLACLYLLDVYNPDAVQRRQRLLLRVVLAQILTFVVITAVYYLWDRGYGRGIVAISLAAQTLLLVGHRIVFSNLLTDQRRSKRLLLAGAGWAGEELIRAIRGDQASDYQVVGLVDDDESLIGTEMEGCTVLGTSDECQRLLMEQDVDHVVVAVSRGRSERFLRNMLRCKAAGARVVEMADLYKQLTHKVPIKHVTDQWFILGGGFDLDSRFFLRNAIRMLDVALSVFGLVMATPIVLFAAIAIKLTSRGPVFFTQTRVGQFGEEFTLIKLRTMTQDAESGSGPVWSQKSDPRVTAVGRLLRRTRIDELPQMINVLRGEMSFVGPRPERRFFVDQLNEKIPYYELRHTMKPGITGWAQVCYHYTNDEEGALEKLQYDLYSVQEMTLFLYALVILKTVKTVLTKPGS